MDKEPHEAFDAIRKQLQLILLRAELSQDLPHCKECVTSVCEIVKEIRTLEAFIRDMEGKAS